MIKVAGLTKRFVGNTAVDNISFKVRKGEIAGFLGPNGAGKSTTIRMLTCFLTPTSGRAAINGCDIEKDSIEVRRSVGYMPENVPLYHDMRVDEYLNFRGRLKGMSGGGLKRGVSEAVEVCGLGEVRRKMIATLSKGYRQRVGLADALVNKPELLILDEPTNGLDPQQIRLFRRLIKELGKEHTIFLSTHILPEVEMTCNRVLIINRGKLRASDTPGNLIRRRRQGGNIVLEWSGDESKSLAALQKLKGVAKVRPEQAHTEGGSRFLISANPKVSITDSLFALAVERKWRISEMTPRDPSLEDAFVDIVQTDNAAGPEESQPDPKP